VTTTTRAGWWRRLPILAVCAALSMLAGQASAQAYASTSVSASAHARLLGTGQHFYLERGSSGHTASPAVCWNAHGVGYQVTVSTTGCTNSTWTQTGVGMGVGCNETLTSFQDANGYYLAPGAGGTVTVATAVYYWCVSFNAQLYFLILRDPGTNNYVGTSSTASGTGVEDAASLPNTGWGNEVL
jgi:hypothetical protein